MTLLKTMLATTAVTAGLALAACGGSDSESDSAGGTAAAPATTMQSTAMPAVTIASPADGAMVDSTFTAEVDLSDFKIDAKDVGKMPVDGMGHLHFSLDEGKYDAPKYSGANGDLAVKLGTDGKYSPAVAPQITYKGIPAGEHTLTVALANNDHSDTGASATQTFTVR